MLWTIGGLTLDAARFELRSARGKIHVRRQPLRLLLYLARHSERLVWRDELLREVWTARVCQDALNHCVRGARAALGADGSARLRTIRGCGYQLLVDGAVAREQAEPPEAPATLAARLAKARADAERVCSEALALGERWELPPAARAELLEQLGRALSRAALSRAAVSSAAPFSG